VLGEFLMSMMAGFKKNVFTYTATGKIIEWLSDNEDKMNNIFSIEDEELLDARINKIIIAKITQSNPDDVFIYRRIFGCKPISPKAYENGIHGVWETIELNEDNIEPAVNELCMDEKKAFSQIATVIEESTDPRSNSRNSKTTGNKKTAKTAGEYGKYREDSDRTINLVILFLIFLFFTVVVAKYA
jgi:hypothetical protein